MAAAAEVLFQSLRSPVQKFKGTVELKQGQSLQLTTKKSFVIFLSIIVVIFFSSLILRFFPVFLISENASPFDTLSQAQALESS